MKRTIEYSKRSDVRTVALPADFNLKDVTIAETRLRSWARTRGVPLAAPPFLVLRGDMTCRVHVPIGAEAAPHPETGIETEIVPAGEEVRVHEVRFGELRAVSRELVETMGVNEPDVVVEFHSVDNDFFEGDCQLVLSALPAARPTTLALAGADAEVMKEQPSMAVRVVTIARQHGTGGEAIAASVAQQLGLRLIDYEVFRKAAERADVSPETIANAAAHRGFFSRVLDVLAQGAMTTADPWMAPVPLRTSPLVTSSEYRAFIEDAIRDLAEQGDVLILGHGAQLVLADRSDCFRVLVTGSTERRVERAVAAGLTEDDARNVIRDADQERVDYFSEFYGRGWLEPSTYDLVLNSDRFSVEDASRTIVSVVVGRDAGRRKSLGG